MVFSSWIWRRNNLRIYQLIRTKIEQGIFYKVLMRKKGRRILLLKKYLILSKLALRCININLILHRFMLKYSRKLFSHLRRKKRKLNWRKRSKKEGRLFTHKTHRWIWQLLSCKWGTNKRKEQQELVTTFVRRDNLKKETNYKS